MTPTPNEAPDVLASVDPVTHLRYRQLGYGPDDYWDSFEVCDPRDRGDDGSEAFAVYDEDTVRQLLATQRAEIEQQSHDIERLMNICAEYLAEIDRLEALVETIRDDAINKVMTCSDDQINAALRLEGRHPDDIATIGKQCLKLAMQTVEITALKASAVPEGWRVEVGDDDTGYAYLLGPNGERALIQNDDSVVNQFLAAILARQQIGEKK